MDNKEDIIIERIFDAPPELVWKAWTDEEVTKKWWGPESFTAPSIKIDLRVGGKYIFAMQGPKGSAWDRVMYSAGEYKEIVPPSTSSGQAKMVVTDYFSDKDGNIIAPDKEGQDSNFPKVMTVTVLFEEVESGKTKLSIHYQRPESEEEYQAILKSGMKEGWQSSLNKLADAIK